VRSVVVSYCNPTSRLDFSNAFLCVIPTTLAGQNLVLDIPVSTTAKASLASSPELELIRKRNPLKNAEPLGARVIVYGTLGLIVIVSPFDNFVPPISIEYLFSTAPDPDPCEDVL